MIIIDNDSKSVMELTGDKLIDIKGNRDQIIPVIQKHYALCEYIPNTYVNYVPCFKEINRMHPLRIVSTIHKKTFVIDSELLRNLNLDKIIGRLLGFNTKLLSKIHRDYDIALYGDTNIPEFQVLKIKTKNDLKKYCIYTATRKEGRIWKSNSVITLEGLYDGKNINAISESSGSGTSSLKSISIKKGVSEVLERYSAGVIPKKGNYGNLPICDKVIKLFMENTNTRTSDVLFPISELISNEKYALPGSLLFYPYPIASTWDTTSNGMSCHISKPLAVENGLFELIERDAFVLSWLLKSGIHRIQKDRKIEKLICDLNLEKFDVQLFVIHFDNPIPVVLCIIKDGFKISTSLGVGYNLDFAIKKSLSESGQFNVQNIELEPELKPTDDLIQLHLKHYVNEENYHKIAWFYDVPSISIGQAKSFFHPITNSKELIAYYDESGTKLYSYEYKNPILSYYKRYCMRVISDSLLHIWFGEVVPSSILNSERLRYRKEKLNVQSLNTEIHPFG